MMQSMNKKQIDTTQSSWSYEDLCGRSFKLILPSEGYVASGSGYTDISQTTDGLHQLYNNDSRACSSRSSASCARPRAA